MIKRTLYLISVLLLAVVAEVSAQHAVGVRGGGGYSSVKFNPREESSMTGIHPMFGVLYRYRGGDKVLGGIEIDANFVKKGYKKLTDVKSDYSYNRTVSAIEVPFLWQPHVNMFKKRMSVYLNIGPYLSVITGSSSEKFISKKEGVISETPYDFDPIKDNRFEYGLMGGAGFTVAVWKFDVFAEFRYVYGFSDMLKNPNKYPQSKYYESPISQMNVSFGVIYKFLNKKQNKD